MWHKIFISENIMKRAMLLFNFSSLPLSLASVYKSNNGLFRHSSHSRRPLNIAVGMILTSTDKNKLWEPVLIRFLDLTKNNVRKRKNNLTPYRTSVEQVKIIKTAIYFYRLVYPPLKYSIWYLYIFFKVKFVKTFKLTKCECYNLFFFEKYLDTIYFWVCNAGNNCKKFLTICYFWPNVFPRENCLP